MFKKKKRGKPTELKTFKDYIKWFWWFVWEDDSPLSWIFTIIIAFIVIKFVFFPLTGLLLGTDYPMVAVVSGSMEHKAVKYCTSYDLRTQRCLEYDDSRFDICGKFIDEKGHVNFDEFWELCGDFYDEYNINKQEFSEFKFKNGFNTGDIMVLRGVEYDDVNIGDTIVFLSSCRSDPIIHRVVSKEEVITTKGDHNSGVGNCDVNIDENAIIGKAWFRIPYLGYFKKIIVDFGNYIRR